MPLKQKQLLQHEKSVIISYSRVSIQVRCGHAADQIRFQMTCNLVREESDMREVGDFNDYTSPGVSAVFISSESTSVLSSPSRSEVQMVCSSMCGPLQLSLTISWATNHRKHPQTPLDSTLPHTVHLFLKPPPPTFGPPTCLWPALFLRPRPISTL